MKQRMAVMAALILYCAVLLSACSPGEGQPEESRLSSQTDAVTAPSSSAPDETQASSSTSAAAPSETDSPSTQATLPPVTERPTDPPPTAPPQPQTVRVTIKEGETLTQIFKKLEEKGVASFDSLMEMAQNYDYSYYPLVAARPERAERCFLLEGYLFPDTYDFYVGEKPQDAIGRFLRNSEARITASMRQQAASMGRSMDEILTIASLIQKEGSNPQEVAKIAAVIYNRLDKGMQLQMDAATVYVEQHVKPFLSGDINRYNSYYNTYKCKALPAGPIANPGLVTINAALHPADVPYLFFCHDRDGNYYYATTYEEHQQNLQKLQ